MTPIKRADLVHAVEAANRFVEDAAFELASTTSDRIGGQRGAALHLSSLATSKALAEMRGSKEREKRRKRAEISSPYPNPLIADLVGGGLT